jgi:hypothetical protein
MPGGIGKVSERVMTACSGQERAVDSVSNANEIFFHLDASHVYCDRARGYVYFVDSPRGRVKNTILAALEGMRDEVEIEQLHLDAHKFFNGARRVALGGKQMETVLIALRLAGIAVTAAQASS